ncbi:MAG: hypothetical protein ACTS6O_03145 [Giesbergeria sp.]
MLYLSILSISAQGFAASTMLYCGPAHQHRMTVQETDHHSARGHADDYAADRQHRLQPAVSPVSVVHASSDEKANFTSSDRDLAKGWESGAHEGSEHAACSVGAAVPASSLRFQPAEQAIEPVASRQLLNIGFVTDGPIRPPRSFPA